MNARTVIALNYITKETLDKYVKGKSVIELEVFAEMFEKEFGICIPYKESLDYKKLTDEQKRKMTKGIFSNKDILDQLHEASVHQDYIEDEKEALTILNEARNGKQI